LAALIFCMIFFDQRNTPDDIFPFPILLISTSQGLIFSFSLMTLYVPQKIARKNMIFFNLIPYSILVLLYTVSACFYGDPICYSLSHFFSQLPHPTIVVRLLLFLFNIYQMLYYRILIQKLYVRYKKGLEHYYSDTLELSPEWAKRIYHLALLIGFTAILSSLFKDSHMDSLFTIILCFYYLGFAIMYMRYEQVFRKLDSPNREVPSENIPPEQVSIIEKQAYGFNWEEARHKIIHQKLYLQFGITVNDMAELFNTNRTSFSNALNKNEGQSFSVFINQLRIEHAKELILLDPEMPIATISLQCGFTEQSNFTRQFKKICHETPVAWKEKKLFRQMA